MAGKLIFPDKTPYNITSRISLNDDEITTYSRTDGTFVLYNVGPGVHQLDVHNPYHFFSQVRIQLKEDAMDNPKCLEYAYPGATKVATAHPLILQAHGLYEYFEKRQGFTIMSLVSNPMVLMGVMMVGMMFFMPKMMDSLDPEEKERMRKQMEMQKDPSKMLTHLWGELTGTPEEEPKRTKAVTRSANKRE